MTFYEGVAMQTEPGIEPDIEIDVRAVVLRITYQFEAGLSADQLYERTRGYWVMQPHDHRDVEYAFSLAGDRIREVYRITAPWRRLVAADIPPNPLRRPDPEHETSRTIHRWIFTGEVAPEDVRSRFLEKPLHARARNPVLWINC